MGYSKENSTEDKALFSLRRARRGAKVGAVIGGGLVGASTVAALLFGGRELHQSLINDPIDNLVAMAGFIGYFTGANAALGAAVDSFRPTSKLFSRRIEGTIEDLQAIKNGISGAYRFLSELNYGKVLYNIFRPNLPNGILHHKKDFLSTCTVGGGMGGVVLYGYTAVFNSLEPITGVSVSRDAFMNMILNHPIETVALGAAVGFAASSYALVMHRPIKPPTNYIIG